MKSEAYVYTELQISVPFADALWADINEKLLKQPGFVNKTWLAGTTNNSLGGLYTFETIADAQTFVNGYFPSEAANFGVAQTTRIFDRLITEEASREMNSVHWDGSLDHEPGAFVYTEVQVNAPFDQLDWKAINSQLLKQPGLMAKTWLSGLHTNTPGGLYAFDSIENAREFATGYFPTEARGLNAAFYTRVFDASLVANASRPLNSPFFTRVNAPA